MSPQEDLPLVSIITPALNQGRFIRKTIESILSQDLEILGAATDHENVTVRLEHAGFLPVQELAIGEMTWRSHEGVLVDVIESHAPWVADALQSLTQDPQGRGGCAIVS